MARTKLSEGSQRNWGVFFGGFFLRLGWLILKLYPACPTGDPTLYLTAGMGTSADPDLPRLPSL